jgi:hypothetical protein
MREEFEDAWACVILLEKREPRLPPFEEVREQVSSRYAPIAQRIVFDRLVKQLFAEAGVTLNPAAVE